MLQRPERVHLGIHAVHPLHVALGGAAGHKVARAAEVRVVGLLHHAVARPAAVHCGVGQHTVEAVLEILAKGRLDQDRLEAERLLALRLEVRQDAVVLHLADVKALLLLQALGHKLRLRQWHLGLRLRLKVDVRLRDGPGLGLRVIERRAARLRPRLAARGVQDLGTVEGLALDLPDDIDHRLQAHGDDSVGVPHGPIVDAALAKVVPEDSLGLHAEGVAAGVVAHLVDRDDKLLEQAQRVAAVESGARALLHHPFDGVGVVIGALEAEVEIQHVTQQLAPHVGAAVAAAADDHLQEGRAVLDRLLVEAAVDQEGVEVHAAG